MPTPSPTPSPTPNPTPNPNPNPTPSHPHSDRRSNLNQVSKPGAVGAGIRPLVTHTGAWGYWVQVPLLERPLVEVFPADVPPERLVVEIGPAPEGELSWSATARAAATDALHHALDWAKARKITLYLRPHAAHVVSDIPSTLALLRTHGSLRLAWDASALLAESMLPRRAEHLERMTHAFAGHPQLGCVVGDGPEGGESPMVASGQEVPRVWPG